MQRPFTCLALVATCACTVALEPSAEAVITCTSSSECPGALVCLHGVGRCVSPEGSCVEQRDDGYYAVRNGNACALGAWTGACVDGSCAYCGDGIVENGESCDDGNADENDGCTTQCAIAICGDRVVAAGAEDCDDGNDDVADGCDQCKLVTWSSRIAFGLGAFHGASSRVQVAPLAMAVAPNGTIYFAQNIPPQNIERPSYAPGHVFAISESAQALLRTAGSDTYGTFERAVEEVARDAQLYELTALAVDEQGTLYFAEDDLTATAHILSVDRAGTMRVIVGSGKKCATAPCATGRFALATELFNPGPMAVDRAGRLLYADEADVRTVDARGLVQRVAGTGIRCTDSCGYGGGPATEANLGRICGLAVTPDNTLIIAMQFDDGVGRIVRVDLASGALSAVGSTLTGLSQMVPERDDDVLLLSSNNRVDRLNVKTAALTPVVTTPKFAIGSIAAQPQSDGSMATILSDGTAHVVYRYAGSDLEQVFVSPADATIVPGVLSTSASLRGVSFTFGDDGDIYAAADDAVIVRRGASGVIGSLLDEPLSGISSIARDGATLFLAVPTAGRVYALNDGRLSIVAGTGNPESSMTTASVTDARDLDFEPTALAVHDHQLVVTSRYGLWQIDPASGTATHLVGGAWGAPFRCPSDVVVDANGDVYVDDAYSCSIVRVRDGTPSTFWTDPSCVPPNDQGGCFSASTPTWFDSIDLFGGYLYASSDADGVQRAPTSSTSTPSPSGLELLAVRGGTSVYIENEIALTEGVNDPRVRVSPDGTVYIMARRDAAASGRALARLTNDGRLRTVIGDVDRNFTGPLALATFQSPRQAVMLPDGTTAVVDRDSGTANRINLTTGVIDVIIGQLHGADAVSEGVNARIVAPHEGATALVFDATTQQLTLASGTLLLTATAGVGAFSNDPEGWTVSESTSAYRADAMVRDAATHTLYQCDRAANVVVRTADGDAPTIIAGRAGFTGSSGDGGPAVDALLDAPSALALSPAGSLYIADTGNHRVRRIANGRITTVLGDGTPDNALVGAPAAALTVDTPRGLAFDASGNLLVAGRGVVAVVSADTASGEPDAESFVATVFRADATSADLAACLQVLFTGSSDDALYVGDACSGAFFALQR